MSKEIHIDNLRRLRKAVRRKRPEKWRTNSWFPHHDNAPAHRSVLVNDFLSKNPGTTLEHPLCSPDLAGFNFYLFTGMKSALKVRRFCDTTDNFKNVMEELKGFSQSDNLECLQHLYCRWQNYVFALGGYFEGNIA
jgi:hypothetical protein